MTQNRRHTRNSARQSAWVALVAVLLGLLTATSAQAQQDVEQATELTRPTMQNALAARVVAKMMETLHLSKLPLDDTIAERAFEHYIKALDPLKDYFVQADIDEFSSLKDEIDDKVQVGNFEIAFTIFRRFMKRVDQRTALALEMVDAPHDFTVDETIATDPDLLTFAKTPEETRDKWRKRIKYSLMVLESAREASEKKKKEKAEAAKDSPEETETKPEAKEPDSPKETLRKRYRAFNRRMHQLDTEDVIERYISAITTSFDPHTSYMSTKTYDNFIIAMGLELEGIGATLQGTDDGYTTIKNLVKGGAAAKQGDLKVEDKIYAVGQGNEDGTGLDAKLVAENGTDFVDATGMRLDDVVGMIRGDAGTTVRLQVMSENDGELHTVNIVREKIKLEDQAARGEIFEQGKRADGSPRKIGIIELPSFYADFSGGDGRSTTRDVKKIVDRFNAEGVDGLILDLRMNGGGSLPEAIDLTGLFIDLGPVVQVKVPSGEIEELADDTPGMSWEKPLVVLTSKFSASASEILAGAIQDYGRGLVIGDTTTHGKGTVQSLRNLSEVLSGRPRVPCKHGALKITTAQFYRPNGDSTQKRGVLSDLVLPSITDNMEGIAEADLDFPVEFDRIRRAAFTPVAKISPDLIKTLQTKSAARIKGEEDFIKLGKKIAKYIEQKKLKTVSLNADKYKARREELNADDEDKSLMEEQLESDDTIERTFYLDEVINITSDYLDILSGQTGQ
ncbi:carboxy terminal-processing peptidase [Mariniblastus sp.]|nr:carboxy terminal-processing peptidase [Mariniblastus sp.]